MRGQKKDKLIGAIAAGSLFAMGPIGSTPVLAQQGDFAYPAPDTDSCQFPGKKLVKEASLYFYHGSNRGNYSSPGYFRKAKKWDASWKKFNRECEKICYMLNPVVPDGYGWLRAGMYGNCLDLWIKLIRKDGDRVSVDLARTYRHIEPGRNQKEWSRTVRCSTRDYWDDDIGWKPVKPYTVIDDVVDRFC